MTAKRKKAPESKKASFFKALAIGAGVGIAVWAVLLVGASYLIAGRAEPEKLILPAVFLLAATAAFVAGIVSGKLSGSGVLAPGLITGVLLLAAVWAVSLVCAAGAPGTASLPLKALLCVEFPLFAVIGARMALPSGKPKRRRR